MHNQEPTTVMIVEDEVFIAMSLEIQLKTAGYHVCGRTATGEDAVRAAEELSPDVILMDIRLAGQIDGIEAARKILERAQPVLIFMTGYQGPEVKNAAMALNPRGFLIKPVTIGDIESLLMESM
ncbi:MAG: response regulator [Spirochaetales bacterium]|nr:response regulator [Spirochaetales bacterium]